MENNLTKVQKRLPLKAIEEIMALALEISIEEGNYSYLYESKDVKISFPLVFRVVGGKG